MGAGVKGGEKRKERVIESEMRVSKQEKAREMQPQFICGSLDAGVVFHRPPFDTGRCVVSWCLGLG